MLQESRVCIAHRLVTGCTQVPLILVRFALVNAVEVL